jgi:hypothetical protein
MKPWLNTFLGNFLGAAKPTAPIVKNRIRLLVELLEDRLVPAPVTFTVTNALDAGSGSLRAAIAAANGNGNPSDVDIIQFAPSLAGKTIKLTSGELPINQSVRIQGLGASKLTIDGGAVGGAGGSRIFDIFGGEGAIQVTIKGLTLTDGHASAGDGGAVFHNNGNNNDSLTLQNDVFSNNRAGASLFDEGGAVKMRSGTLLIQSSVFTGNHAGGEGGAVQCEGNKVTIQDSTFVNNVAGTEGGAVMIDRGTAAVIERSTFSKNTGGALWFNDGFGGNATISQSAFYGNVENTGEGGGGAIGNESGSLNLTIQGTTISGNSTTMNGGGILDFSGNLTLKNCTISGNSAATDGGGVYTNGGTFTAINCTIALNKANQGGGLFNEGSTVTLNNTIVSDNAHANGLNDLFLGGGTINAQYSLIETPAGSVNGSSSHNIFFFSANLGPLQYNGGPVPILTLKPKHGSKALMAGSIALLTADMTTDERGLARTYGGTVDIGAVEGSLDNRRGWGAPAP